MSRTIWRDVGAAARKLVGGVCVLGVAGCAFVPFLASPLEIVAVKSVEAVDWIRAPETVRSFGVPAPTEAPVLALRIVFETAQDVRTWGYRHTVWPRAQASLCRGEDFDPRRRIAAGTYVYDRDGSITTAAPTPPGRQAETHIYVFLMTTSGSFDARDESADHWAVGHDLRRNPGDVCARFWTANMFIPGPNSNTMVIPYATIRAALDRAGM